MSEKEIPYWMMWNSLPDNTEIGDDWWIFGFDTFHYGDNEYDWDKQAVVQETRYLMKQLDK